MPYHFPEDIQREIDAFAEDDVGQVDQEVRIAKWLLKQAVERGNFGLANAVMATLAKLSATQVQNEVRSGRTLEMATVVNIARLMSAAVGRLLDGLPGQAELTDRLNEDFSRIIRQERLRLTHDKSTGDDNASRD